MQVAVPALVVVGWRITNRGSRIGVQKEGFRWALSTGRMRLPTKGVSFMTGKSFGRKSVRRKLLLSVVPLAAGLAMASGPALASADTTVGQTPAPQRVWTQNLQLVSSGAIVGDGGLPGYGHL
jgi:hypothetical protein